MTTVGEAEIPDDAAVGMLVAAGETVEQLRQLLDVESYDDVLPAVQSLQTTADEIAVDLSEATQRVATLVPAVKRLLTMTVQLISELSWCAGNLSADDQQLPDSVAATLKEAIALVGEISTERA